MVRIKERYLLVNIIYPSDPAKTAKSTVPDFLVHRQPTIERLTPQALLKAIRAEVALLFGDYGSGALEGNLSVKYLSLATSTFILRCSRAHYQLLWSALTFMDHVPVRDGRPCILRVVRVSGTIRKAEEEAIRQARMLILAAKQEANKLPSMDPPYQRDHIMLNVTDGSAGGGDDGDDDDDDANMDHEEG